MAFQGDSIFWVEVEKIVPNPFQPRREFDEAKLKELSESVRMYGILQPLTVTRKEIQREDGAFYSEYELIAGERRLRASRLAGLAQVPVIIREGENSEQEKLELAIIENLQREDLNAVDRALAFRQLADVFTLSHAQVAQKVGRSREYVSNTLRLLLLPDYMLSSVKVGDMSEGHARTLLMLNSRPEELDTVYREILLKKLSVREVERIARKIAQDKVRKKVWADTDPALIEMEKKFTESLGTRVQIAKTDYGGKITIDYFSDEDLGELLTRLKKERTNAAAVSAAAFVAVSDEMEDINAEEREILERLSQGTVLEGTRMESPEATESVPEDHSESITPDPALVSPVASFDNARVDELTNGATYPAVADPNDVPQTEVFNTLPQTETVAQHETTQEDLSSDPIEHNVENEEDDDSGLYTIKNFGV
ncbi:MAG: ParB family chromosome partitioning protein [Candidatus Azotimanducaceae bacterium]|jgi:ParB family chromosome partitioning protein